MGRLEGRSAVITGAGSGIGRATSLIFAREGARLVLVDRTDGVDETVEMVHAAGGTAIAVKGDAGEEADVKGFIDRAVAEHGGLDAIFANAGIGAAPGAFGPIDQLTPEGWMAVLRVNLIGPFLAIKHAVPVMRAAGKGSIICTASVAGIRSGAGGLPYSASKAGVINLVQTSANALYGSGIRVNGVEPRAAVLSEGAAQLVGHTLRPDQVERVEAMVEATVALCCGPRELTGRRAVSLDLIDELGLAVHELDGTEARPRRPS